MIQDGMPKLVMSAGWMNVYFYLAEVANETLLDSSV